MEKQKIIRDIKNNINEAIEEEQNKIAGLNIEDNKNQKQLEGNNINKLKVRKQKK